VVIAIKTESYPAATNVSAVLLLLGTAMSKSPFELLVAHESEGSS
jgi:hypothetical protein